jgi:hypothetical protein
MNDKIKLEKCPILLDTFRRYYSIILCKNNKHKVIAKFEHWRLVDDLMKVNIRDNSINIYYKNPKIDIEIVNPKIDKFEFNFILINSVDWIKLPIDSEEFKIE